MRPKKTKATAADHDADQKVLAEAVAEIVRNDATPDELRDAVATFLCDASSGDSRAYYSSAAVCLHVLRFHERKKLDS